ncbi:transporter [Clostridia bacterium]|nr:transporter [Clostridia bacterium]
MVYARRVFADSRTRNTMRRWLGRAKKLLLAFARTALLIGVSYSILAPLIGVTVNSFFSNADKYNPLVYVIPMAPTLERYRAAMDIMNYVPAMGKLLAYVLSLAALQVAVSSMAGYGFARFQFRFKGLCFACVVLTIVIPAQNLILPLYTTFRTFDPLGIVSWIAGSPINLLKQVTPMYIMTAFGVGLRSGLYIYIFTQFFRGLPKELEEAALVDGAGFVKTFVRVMLPNAAPAIVTVSIFSIVWQYNDTFFSNVFLMPSSIVVSKLVSNMSYLSGQAQKILDPEIMTLYTYAGVVLLILPLVVLYVVLQKRFMEGMAKSGIVG